MGDFAASLGRMLIFSTLLPGVLACAAMMVLFPEIPIGGFSTIQISFAVFGVGFLANALGHFTEIVVSKMFRKWPKTPYSELIEVLPKVEAQLSGILTHDIDYLECLHVWYWNSGIVLLLSGIARVWVITAKHEYQPSLVHLLVGVCLVVGPILFYLAYVTQQGTMGWVRQLKRQVSSETLKIPQHTAGGDADGPGASP